MAPSSLLLCFISLVAGVLAAAADGQGGDKCAAAACGNLTISYPFGVVSNEATESNCVEFGFQVVCSGNTTPYLGISYTGRPWFQILNISYEEGSLLVADLHKLHDDFNSSARNGCQAPSLNSSSKLGNPFSISPLNQNLIFYNCTKPLAEEVRQKHGLVDTICRNNTFVRTGGHYDDVSDRYGDYFLEGCEAIVAPVLVGSRKANASNYRELISDGFLLTWHQQPPPAGKFTL